MIRRQPASMDPSSKSYQRLARRIASNSLRGCLRTLRCFGSPEDLEAAANAIYTIADAARARTKEAECDPQ